MDGDSGVTHPSHPCSKPEPVDNETNGVGCNVGTDDGRGDGIAEGCGVGAALG